MYIFYMTMNPFFFFSVITEYSVEIFHMYILFFLLENPKYSVEIFHMNIH